MKGRLPLIFILALGASLRLLWLHTPLIDDHRWRQADTAAMARNLYEDRFDVFHPEIDWGGPHGYVESEFPLMAAIVAAGYEIFGQQDYYGRLVAVIFSVATIAATSALAAELLNPAAGLAAAYLVATSPATVYFGRSFMPDSTMIFFWVFGVFAFVRSFRLTADEGPRTPSSRRWLWIGSASAALACLTKLPAIIMFAPIAAAAWHWRGRAALRDRELIAALAVPLLVTLAWYAHAARIFRQTGLTFGILLHPAKTYPLSVAPGPWIHAWSKYATLALLANREFYLRLVARLYIVLLLPWGVVGALAGATLWKRPDGRPVADAWLAAMVLFIVIMGEVNFTHEYYQLPLVPLGALYFGAALAPFFAGSWAPIKDNGLGRAVVLMAAAVLGFYFSGVARTHYLLGNLDERIFLAGRAVERAVPSRSLLIVADDHGVTSPLLLYFAHRKGWSFDPENLYPQVIDGLRRQGANYYATTRWSDVKRAHPETAYYLETFPQVALNAEPFDTKVFDIGAERQ